VSPRAESHSIVAFGRVVYVEAANATFGKQWLEKWKIGRPQPKVHHQP
jgi:hypothetical protein